MGRNRGQVARSWRAPSGCYVRGIRGRRCLWHLQGRGSGGVEQMAGSCNALWPDGKSQLPHLSFSLRTPVRRPVQEI